jgi:hypothetical protein
VDALFWATVAIAAGTFVLAVGTVILAWSTRKGVDLQEKELEAVKDQLKLAREEFAYAQAASRPQLDIDVGMSHRADGDTAGGRVRYLHGSEPAYDIEVWVKARTGAFGKSLGTIQLATTGETRAWPACMGRAAATWCLPSHRMQHRPAPCMEDGWGEPP